MFRYLIPIPISILAYQTLSRMVVMGSGVCFRRVCRDRDLDHLFRVSWVLVCIIRVLVSYATLIFQTVCAVFCMQTIMQVAPLVVCV